MTNENEIRTISQRERAQIVALLARLNQMTTAQLRQQLSLAAATLDIVDDCISPARLAEPRTASRLAWWLIQTRKLLSAVEIQTKYAADLIEKFGDDLRVI